MNKDTFEMIQTNLQTRIDECKKHLEHIITTDDLRNITVNEAQELKAWAKQEAAIMTEIVMVDFYHIIGMGELTVLQTNTFIKLIKEYMSYRSDLKTISTHFSLDNLPVLPSKSEFTLKQLGNITLTSKVRGRTKAASTVVESSDVNDYANAKQDLQDCKIAGESEVFGPFKVESNVITFPTAALADFIRIVNPSYSMGKIAAAAAFQKNSGREYADIFWRYTSEANDKIRAIVSTKNGYFV